MKLHYKDQFHFIKSKLSRKLEFASLVIRDFKRNHELIKLSASKVNNIIIELYETLKSKEALTKSYVEKICESRLSEDLESQERN